MPKISTMIWAAALVAAAKKTEHRCPRGQCQRRNIINDWGEGIPTRRSVRNKWCGLKGVQGVRCRIGAGIYFYPDTQNRSLWRLIPWQSQGQSGIRTHKMRCNYRSGIGTWGGGLGLRRLINYHHSSIEKSPFRSMCPMYRVCMPDFPTFHTISCLVSRGDYIRWHLIMWPGHHKYLRFNINIVSFKWGHGIIVINNASLIRMAM